MPGVAKRAIAPAPSNPRDDFSYEVAGAWSALSPFKDETGIAVERFRLMYEKGLDPVLLYYAIATLAVQERDARHPGAPYHAVAFTEEVARAFSAKIAEIMRDIEKADEGNVISLARRRERGLRHISGAARTILEHSGGTNGKHEG